MHQGVERLPRRTRFSLLPLFTYLCILGTITLFVARHPKIGWDMLGYIGVIESWNTSDGQLIQNQAYTAVRKLPEYDELTGNATCQPATYVSYRSDVAHNSAHFIQQLPILAIKPLYVVFVSVLHKGGLSYVRSFAIVSAAAYFVLGALTWLWLSRYWSSWTTTVFGCLLIVNPEILSVVRSTSPDGIALAMISLGLYMLLEHVTSVWGPIFLLVSIWVRPDSLILVGLLFVTCLLSRAIPEIAAAGRIGYLRSLGILITKNWDWLLLCILALASYLTIQFFAHFYSWSILFYHSFVGYLVAPADTVVHITPRLYFHTVAANARTLLSNTQLVVFLLMSFVAVSLHSLRNYRYITICVIVAMFLHFLFFPTDSIRFHVAAVFFAPISMLIACVGHVRLSALLAKS
jgi:hypothetical protein